MRALNILLVLCLAFPLFAGEPETRLAKASQLVAQGRDAEAIPDLQWVSAKSWRNGTGERATVP